MLYCQECAEREPTWCDQCAGESLEALRDENATLQARVEAAETRVRELEAGLVETLIPIVALLGSENADGEIKEICPALRQGFGDAEAKARALLGKPKCATCGRTGRTYAHEPDADFDEPTGPCPDCTEDPS